MMMMINTDILFKAIDEKDGKDDYNPICVAQQQRQIPDARAIFNPRLCQVMGAKEKEIESQPNIFEEEQEIRVGSSEVGIFDQCLPASARIRSLISVFLILSGFDQ